MSRSSCTDDIDNWSMIRWRGAVKSAIRGKRGQELLTELAEAMDLMPVKELIANNLVKQGSFCALGVVGLKRGIALESIDHENISQVVEHFGITKALASEIMYINDEAWFRSETPQQRWCRLRQWVDSNIQRNPKMV